MLVQATNW